MNIFRDIQRKAASVHDKRQAVHYKKLRSDTKRMQLQKEKLERMRQAKRSRAAASGELRAMKTPKKRTWRLPKLVGDLKALTKGMPSDKELNRAVFGSPSPRAPKGTTRIPSDNELAKDIFK